VVAVGYARPPARCAHHELLDAEHHANAWR
jgi:hypothetical protein